MRSQPFPLLWGLQVHLEGRTNSNTSYINEQVPHSSSQRCYSSKGTSTLGKGGPKESQASQPWYSKFKQALFPVDDAPVEEGPHTKQPMQKPHARSPAMLQYQQYQQQQQQRGPGSTPARAPALTPQAKAERLTGNLFKASLLCISLPLAAHVVLVHLVVNQVMNGLKSKRASLQKSALERIQSYIWFEFQRQKFEELDGVMLLAGLLNENIAPEIADEFLKTVAYFLRYDSTMHAMLMAQMLERFEKALTNGWFPAASRELAKTVYLDLHAARRAYMESTYGPQKDPALVKPLRF